MWWDQLSFELDFFKRFLRLRGAILAKRCPLPLTRGVLQLTCNLECSDSTLKLYMRCQAISGANMKDDLFYLQARGYQRQTSFSLEDYIPTEAISDIKDLLRLLFGANIPDQGYRLPTAEEILRESKAFPVKEFLERHSR